MHQLARIPLRFGDAEAFERQRNAGQRGDAVGEQRERPDQLRGARVHRRSIFGADDLQRVEQTMDDAVRDPYQDRGGDKCQQNGGDDGVADLHQSRCILRKLASTRARSALMFTMTTTDPVGSSPRPTSSSLIRVPAESTSAPISVRSGTTPQ